MSSDSTNTVTRCARRWRVTTASAPGSRRGVRARPPARRPGSGPNATSTRASRRAGTPPVADHLSEPTVETEVDARSRVVLVTGGAGYIGSQACVTLLDAGARVVVIDNLDNSSAVALDRVRELVPDAADQLVFVRGDIRDATDLDRAFAAAPIDSVL